MLFWYLRATLIVVQRLRFGLDSCYHLVLLPSSERSKDDFLYFTFEVFFQNHLNVKAHFWSTFMHFIYYWERQLFPLGQSNFIFSFLLLLLFFIFLFFFLCMSCPNWPTSLSVLLSSYFVYFGQLTICCWAHPCILERNSLHGPQ